MRFIGILAFVVALVITMVALDMISCESKWKESGFDWKYTVTSGCMIQMPDGRWIPSENYREL